MPTWKDLRNFLLGDGYEQFKHDGDHYWFRKQLPDGRLNIVKVSRGTGEIGKAMFHHILKQQLGVTKEYFNKKK